MIMLTHHLLRHYGPIEVVAKLRGSCKTQGRNCFDHPFFSLDELEKLSISSTRSIYTGPSKMLKKIHTGLVGAV